MGTCNPEYEAAAPVKMKGWNHVKLVIFRSTDGGLRQWRTECVTEGGLSGPVMPPWAGLQFRGDAMYANLTIAPDAVEGLTALAPPDPAAADPRYVRHWRLAPLASLPRGHSPNFHDAPAETSTWEHLDVERKGFVNLGRAHGTPQGVPDLAWLNTDIASDHAQVKHVAIGWARQIWVYVNGKQVFAANNLYYPESARKPPLGRMSLENDSFDLPLRQGDNRVSVAISDDLGHIRHWGWGFEFKLDDASGIRM